VPTLHQRASDWYAQQGLTADAIRHALAARDFVRAAGLIELAWPAMDGRFQSATWLGWARELPDAVVSNRPVLAVAYGWALLNDGELEAADAHLAAAESWLDERAENGRGSAERNDRGRSDADAESAASLATARTYQAQARGDIRGSVKYGQQALQLLPADDHSARPAAARFGLAQWALGDLEPAHQAISEAMANFQKAGNLHFAISGTYGMADIRVVQGRLHDAISTYKQVLQIALSKGEPPLRGSAELYLGLSELIANRERWSVRCWHLQRSEELGEEAGLPDWRYRIAVPKPDSSWRKAI
jgi:LuxR family maltose regulon positive regulatory protein